MTSCGKVVVVVVVVVTTVVWVVGARENWPMAVAGGSLRLGSPRLVMVEKGCSEVEVLETTGVGMPWGGLVRRREWAFGTEGGSMRIEYGGEKKKKKRKKRKKENETVRVRFEKREIYPRGRSLFRAMRDPGTCRRGREMGRNVDYMQQLRLVGTKSALKSLVQEEMMGGPNPAKIQVAPPPPGYFSGLTTRPESEKRICGTDSRIVVVAEQWQEQLEKEQQQNDARSGRQAGRRGKRKGGRREGGRGDGGAGPAPNPTKGEREETGGTTGEGV